MSLMEKVDGYKTQLLVIGNSIIAGYMMMNPGWAMPEWMQLLDAVLFAGAFRSAMNKKPGAVK